MLKHKTIKLPRRVHIFGDLNMTVLMHYVSHYGTFKIKQQQRFTTLNILNKKDFTNPIKNLISIFYEKINNIRKKKHRNVFNNALTF